MTKSNSRNKVALKITKVFGIQCSYTTHGNTANEKKDKKPKSNTDLELPHINATKHLRNTKILLSKQSYRRERSTNAHYHKLRNRVSPIQENHKSQRIQSDTKKPCHEKDHLHSHSTSTAT